MGFTGVAPPRAPAGGLPQDKFKDPVAYFQHREAAVAEEFVHVGEAKLLREKLRQCYREAGTNYITDCKELAQSYLQSIRGVGIARANEQRHDKALWAADR